MRSMPVAPTANRHTAPLLNNGDRMTQAEFHRRYEQMPGVKAELIGGIVYMASPVRRPHGNHLPKLSMAFCLYEGETPGVEVLDDTTTILSETSEPQPDLALRILPEFGGRSRTNEAEYVEGGPELVAEVAHSSLRYDLDQKLTDYRDAGVQEYVVWSIEEPELHWFDFTKDKPLRPNRQGIYCSRAFPGLWIDRDALLARDTRRIAAAVQQGTASRPHAAFVKRLATAHRKHTSD